MGELPTTSDPSARPDRAPLLLYSLEELRSVWRPVLELAGARTVTEIGAEEGINALALARWLSDRGGRLTIVDPSPRRELVAAQDEGELRIVRGYSPGALADVPPNDAYLLDGDHNYAVVSAELAAIFAGGRTPVAVLHDVGWPCARRDLYYDPERLAPEDRHDYDYDLGVWPGEAEARPGGYRGSGEFAFARVEGGPRNGVLTAVEDFLAGRSGLRFSMIPSVFGLGVIYPADAPFADAVASHLDGYDAELLGRLESNRMDLFVRLLTLQDENQAAQAAHADSESRLAASEQRLADARRDLEEFKRHLDAREAERSARELTLRQEVAELTEQRDRLAKIAVALEEPHPARPSLAERLRRAIPDARRSPR